MQRSRIYLGPANTSNVFKELEKSLRIVGLKADFIPWSSSQHEFYNKNEKTFQLFDKPPFKIFGKNIFFLVNNCLLKPFYFLITLFKYNTFFFVKPTTFFPNNKDLQIINFFNKKIAFFYVGCNDRNPLFSNAPDYVCNLCIDKNKQTDNNCNNLALKKDKALYYEKFSEKVFGFKDNIDYLKEKGSRFYLGMNNIKIPYHQKSYSGELKILHLPSNPLVKGTSIIEPILKQIEREEDVEIIIKKENWSRESILNALKEGHILIDSLASCSFGKISVEAIQYGCVPLNAYPDWIAEYYEMSPVVKVDKDTLYNKLKELIADRDLLKKYAAQTQESFNKYFTYQTAGNYYKKQLNLK